MNQSQILLTNLEIFHATSLQNLKTEGQAFSSNYVTYEKALIKIKNLQTAKATQQTEILTKTLQRSPNLSRYFLEITIFV